MCLVAAPLALLSVEAEASAPQPSFVVILADEEWAEGAGVAPWPWVIRPFRWEVAALGLASLAAAALIFA